MEKLLEITLNLSANPYRGSCTFDVVEYAINKTTDKTIIITGRLDMSIRRHKSELLKVKECFKNERVSRLRFSTICYPEDEKTAKDLLIASMDKCIKLLNMEHEAANKAWNER